MKIAICGSISYYKEIAEVQIELKRLECEVVIPESAEKVLNGEITIEQLSANKDKFTQEANKEKHRLITGYMEKIKDSDAILVANYDKNGIQNYIGGNTLMEMAFALAYGKNIYLLNSIPDIGYTDEIAGCLPIVINGDLSLMK